MHAIVNIAIRAARKAGAYIMTERDRQQHKFDAEKLAQLQETVMHMLAEAILTANPHHGIIGLEDISPDAASRDMIWQIDMSGTENLLRRIPHFALVMVVCERDNVKHAVIFDPYTDEIFSSTLGTGAQCNDYRLRMQARTLMLDAMPGAIIGDALKRINYGENVSVYNQGCPALAMAYLAADRFNGFVGDHLSKAELLAGSLLIQEAGGLLGDLQGGHDYLAKGELIAAHPKAFKTLVQRVNGAENTVGKNPKFQPL